MVKIKNNLKGHFSQNSQNFQVCNNMYTIRTKVIKKNQNIVPQMKLHCTKVFLLQNRHQYFKVFWNLDVTKLWSFHQPFYFPSIYTISSLTTQLRVKKKLNKFGSQAGINWVTKPVHSIYGNDMHRCCNQKVHITPHLHSSALHVGTDDKNIILK